MEENKITGGLLKEFTDAINDRSGEVTEVAHPSFTREDAEKALEAMKDVVDRKR